MMLRGEKKSLFNASILQNTYKFTVWLNAEFHNVTPVGTCRYYYWREKKDCEGRFIAAVQ
jgi:hypothetical protein